MKVCVIALGSFANYCYCLANALVDEGVQVVLYTDAKYTFDRYETRFTLKKIIGPTRKFAHWSGKLFIDVKREKPDIIHVQFYREYLMVDLFIVSLLKRTGAAMAFTFHDAKSFKAGAQSPVTTAHHPLVLKYLFLPLFDAFFVHSATTKTDVQAMYGLDASRITVVPHGIMDFYKFDRVTRARAREFFKLCEQDYALLYFGNIGLRKGLEDLVRAHAALKKAGHERIKLILAGRGKEYYERKLRSLADKSVILFKGLQRIPDEDIELLFKAADVIVLPYIESTTSGNLKIAIAFNKPVIATNIGEFPDYAGKYAIELVQPKDAKGIEKAVLRRMLNRNQESAILLMPGHTWSEVAEATKRCYQNITKVADA
jgi:glycosyltransferase involved in cell wall biosynthesis